MCPPLHLSICASVCQQESVPIDLAIPEPVAPHLHNLITQQREEDNSNDFVTMTIVLSPLLPPFPLVEGYNMITSATLARETQTHFDIARMPFRTPGYTINDLL